MKLFSVIANLSNHAPVMISEREYEVCMLLNLRGLRQMDRKRGRLDICWSIIMKSKIRNESYIWGPFLFNVEKAKAFVKNLPTFRFTPTEKLLGLPTNFSHITDEDLNNPIIFASFFYDDKDNVAVVMIDGNNRMRYALKHNKPLLGVIIDPHQTGVFVQIVQDATNGFEERFEEAKNNALYLKYTFTRKEKP